MQAELTQGASFSEFQEIAERAYKMADAMMRARPYVAPTNIQVLFGERARNCLKGLNVTTFAQLAKYTEKDLLVTPNLGRTTLHEIKSLMNYHGFKLKEQE